MIRPMESIASSSTGETFHLRHAKLVSTMLLNSSDNAARPGNVQSYDEATYKDMMFGTEEKVMANGNQHGFALVKCTRDISSSSYHACLGRVTEQIKNCCQNRRGWRILSPNCYLRYEEYLFYQQSMAMVSSVPVTP
ncbi:hypothetical protein Dsin_027796 [Dipteronia sinensis]|uniref:Gnk2-homologous domain-containing protein n=1 Tax=Dipteronia sinensis TaxID=43782 RepID=A0AAD9ZPC4_9ROSI|nr:hypothetical protein Dsin_027796 [Dipteronia sinensis]